MKFYYVKNDDRMEENYKNIITTFYNKEKANLKTDVSHKSATFYCLAKNESQIVAIVSCNVETIKVENAPEIKAADFYGITTVKTNGIKGRSYKGKRVNGKITANMNYNRYITKDLMNYALKKAKEKHEINLAFVQSGNCVKFFKELGFKNLTEDITLTDVLKIYNYEKKLFYKTVNPSDKDNTLDKEEKVKLNYHRREAVRNIIKNIKNAQPVQ